jgi:hypothetical protein
LSEDTDVFVITPTDKHFSTMKLKIRILMTENCIEIEDVLKFESLEACKGFGWLG